MRKLLITGASGFVAGSIISQALNDWEVHGIVRKEIPALPVQVNYVPLDIRESEALQQLIRKIKPDTVIHCAALASIDFCEENKSIAEQVNVKATVSIASVCQKIDAKMIFCSTDTVFDGKKGNYTETDLPAPVNVYAETKAKAEQLVLEASPANIVARLALVTGLPVLGRGNSFLPEMIEKLSRNEEIKSPVNEIRTPVDVITAGKALTELAGSEFSGIIHIAGNTKIKRFDMIRQMASALGFPENLIIPANSNAIPGRAPRPDDASMDNSKARQLLKTSMLSLEEGLAISVYSKYSKNEQHKI